jgi:hypothetical protein
MPMLGRQDLLLRTIFVFGRKVGISKQAREQVIIIEPKSTAPSTLILPADEVTQGFVLLGFIQTSLSSRISQMPHGRHI